MRAMLDPTSAHAGITTQELSKRYGGCVALDQFSAAFPGGRLTALVGANGAGKTTLLRILSGLCRADAGDALVDGVRLSRHGEEPRASVGFVSARATLIGDLSVREMVDAGGWINELWDASTAWRLIDGGRIAHSKRVRELSDGQRTRLALGLAVARQPSCLLLDEPLAPLDPLARQDLLELVCGLKAAGQTLVVSSHEISDLEPVCEHAVVMHAGRCVASFPWTGDGAGLNLRDTVVGHLRAARGPADGPLSLE